MEVINVKNVSKAYGVLWRKRSILNSIDLSVRNGECVSILGENGAGKSTLIKILVKLIPHNKGRFQISGKYSYVPETSINCQNLTLEQNMHYYNKVTHGIGSYHDFEKKIELAQTKKPVRNFSKGMKRKLDIIRALNVDPSALIMDEPFEGLDPMTCGDILNILEEEKKNGKSILMSSHYLTYVERISDRIFLLKDGTLREFGKDWKAFLFLTVEGNGESVMNLIDTADCQIEVVGTSCKISSGNELAINEIKEKVSSMGIKIINQGVETLEQAYIREIRKMAS